MLAWLIVPTRVKHTHQLSIGDANPVRPQADAKALSFMAWRKGRKLKVTRYDYTVSLRWHRGLPEEFEITYAKVDGSTAQALMIEMADAEFSTDDPGAPRKISSKVVFLDAMTVDPSGANVSIVDGEVWMTVSLETRNLADLSQRLRTEDTATVEVTLFGNFGEGWLRFNEFEFKPDRPA